MADVTANNLEVVRPLGGVPYGNMTILPFEVTLASGVFTDSDKATAVAANDVIIAGTIPAGFKLYDALISSNGTADLGATNADLDVGFEYADGVDVTALPEAVDNIFDGVNADAAIFARRTVDEIPPIAFTKDAYLTIKVLTAALSGTGTLRVTLFGICDQ